MGQWPTGLPIMVLYRFWPVFNPQSVPEITA